MPLTAVILFALLSLAPSPVAAQVSSGAAVPEALMLRPGDLLQVKIWREEDMSGEFLVDEDGTVTLPLLGQRQVAQQAFASVRDRLLEEYREQLRNPSITILPLRRVYVLGEVNQPGQQLVDPTTPLAGVIAMAQGATSQGDISRIRLIREGRVIMDGAKAEASLASMDVRSGDQIFVERRSWFDRNSTFLVSVLISVTSIVITLLQ